MTINAYSIAVTAELTDNVSNRLMAIAESVTKVHAVCVKCGDPALYSYRLVANDATVLLGEKESYEPRCRACYNLPA